MGTNQIIPPTNSPTKVTMTKELINEMKLTLDRLEGKELEQGKLTDMNPGVSSAWYIAYST